jgi:hypothetical protein
MRDAIKHATGEQTTGTFISSELRPWFQQHVEGRR